MHVLVLGSGGREHAIAWKIGQSKFCELLYVAPGNSGTASIAENVNLAINDFEAIASFALEKAIDLIVVGPEAPLVEGITDYFRNNPQLKSIAILGPDKAGAQLEGSKSFAKDFMHKYGIPTATFSRFTGNEYQEARQYLFGGNMPIVLKADGLAAGKGVRVCFDLQEAEEALQDILLDKKYGEAGNVVVIESYLKGIELSIFALSDGSNYVLLPEAKDYKRIGENDSGPNTGGMGAISPIPFATPELYKKIVEQVVDPTIRGIKEEGMDYRGFIYFGLMICEGNPFVIEYNCRMGDPETEAVIPRISNDFLTICYQAAIGNLGDLKVEIDPRATSTVVLVAKGYPEDYPKGMKIELPANQNDGLIFHMGTKQSGNDLVSSGGRVLAVTCYGDSKEVALSKALAMADSIRFDNKYFRSDIGFDLK